MKKGSEVTLLFFVGVLLISLLGIVFTIRMIGPMLESNRQAQAEIMANMIAVSANTLYTVDSGYMMKDFLLKEGMKVEVADEGGVSKVKITYNEKGDSYSVPLLVNIGGMAEKTVNRVFVIKEASGKFFVKGEVTEQDFTSTGELSSSAIYAGKCGPCTEPSDSAKQGYVANAAQKTMPDCLQKGQEQEWKALIMALIMQETCTSSAQCFNHCKGGSILESAKGAQGLMQLIPSTASGLKFNGNIINPCDSEQNVFGGAVYLGDMMKEFGCNRELALAAYNGGDGYLRDKIAECKANAANSGSCSSWDTLVLYIGKRETRGYVPGVLAYYNNCYKPGAACGKGCRLC